ncbi:major facilitator superfamily domain-containing protein [Mycena maculata]|uniref:Major facilitator superfamily domain-containing protein n=1 Tax=Mycena maculata TaxID=230809 RepID=A0AAD7I2W1_9AGAR|nr:major facilitator superfamily domain-containing protein [Mycena maculata]
MPADSSTIEGSVEFSGDSDENDIEQEAPRHWWKRPAPWWLLVLTFISTVIQSATGMPRFELYRELVCQVHQTEETFASLYLPSDYLLYSPLGPHWFNVITNDARENTEKAHFKASAFGCDSGRQFVEAATLAAVLETTVVVLSFMTVGWWGSFSDRYGRTRVIAIASIGQLLAAVNIIFVAKYVQRIPGGYWFLVIDSVISGALGGTSSELVAVMAYMADVSTPEKRSLLFSFLFGIRLASIGVGPILGRGIINITHNLLWVFYLAAVSRIFQACFVLFVLPESLRPAQMDRASRRRQEERWLTDRPTPWWYRHLFFLLHPFSVLWPHKISDENRANGTKRDWTIFILVMAYGLMLMATSSERVYLFYIWFTLRWDLQDLLYYTSSIAPIRAAYLILVFPLVIKFFAVRQNRQNDAPSTSPSEAEPLLSGSSRPSVSDAKTHNLSKNLTLMRFSMLVNIAAFAILPFAPTGLVFILFAMLGSFGAGLAPAVHSVALELYTLRIGTNAPLETGKLLGALSAVWSIFPYFLGPLLYWHIYAATFGTFPGAFLFVALGNGILAFALLTFVRFRTENTSNEDVRDLVNPRTP